MSDEQATAAECQCGERNLYVGEVLCHVCYTVEAQQRAADKVLTGCPLAHSLAAIKQRRVHVIKT